jgi:hypothetical protein
MGTKSGHLYIKIKEMSAADDGKAVIGRRDPIKKVDDYNSLLTFSISLSTRQFASVPKRIFARRQSHHVVVAFESLHSRQRCDL